MKFNTKHLALSVLVLASVAEASRKSGRGKKGGKGGKSTTAPHTSSAKPAVTPIPIASAAGPKSVTPPLVESTTPSPTEASATTASSDSSTGTVDPPLRPASPPPTPTTGESFDLKKAQEQIVADTMSAVQKSLEESKAIREQEEATAVESSTGAALADKDTTAPTSSNSTPLPPIPSVAPSSAQIIPALVEDEVEDAKEAASTTRTSPPAPSTSASATTIVPHPVGKGPQKKKSRGASSSNSSYDSNAPASNNLKKAPVDKDDTDFLASCISDFYNGLFKLPPGDDRSHLTESYLIMAGALNKLRTDNYGSEDFIFKLRKFVDNAKVELETAIKNAQEAAKAEEEKQANIRAENANMKEKKKREKAEQREEIKALIAELDAQIGNDSKFSDKYEAIKKIPDLGKKLSDLKELKFEAERKRKNAEKAARIAEDAKQKAAQNQSSGFYKFISHPGFYITASAVVVIGGAGVAYLYLRKPVEDSDDIEAEAWMVDLKKK